MTYGRARIVDHTAGLSRQEWVSRRSLGIGASEVAAVLGVSRYAGPWTVAARKLGVLTEHEDTMATRYGRALEPMVLDLASERLGVPVQPVPYTLAPVGGAPLRVSLDAWDGRRPVEAKRPFRAMDHEAWQQLESDGCPAEGSSLEAYWWQVQAQIGTCGSDSGVLAGLLGGTLYCAEMPADPAAWDQIENEVGELWRRIEEIRADPELIEVFLRGGVIAPTAADRDEWQREVPVRAERLVVDMSDDAALDAEAERLRVESAQLAALLQSVERREVALIAAATSRGATGVKTAQYECAIRLTRRTTSCYDAEAPKEALDKLAALEKEVSQLKAVLKPHAIRSQSVRLDVFPRR